LGGKPLVLWSVEAFLGHEDVAGVTVVLPAEVAAEPPAWLADLRSVTLVAGGAERSDSVRLGLETVPEKIDKVAIHDGARPLITSEAIGRVLEAVRPDRGAVGGRRVTDSLKEANAEGVVVAAPDRERIWRAETPQAFTRELILDAHRRAAAEGFHASDCAGICQRYGIEVAMVEIEEPNPKVTRREDLDWVEAWMARSPKRDVG
jgi:2-C-methyl-D-erythritol 4-phosphate cytidylyltransferase